MTKPKDIETDSILRQPGFYIKLIVVITSVITLMIMSDAALILYSNLTGETVIEVASIGSAIACGSLLVAYIGREEHHISELLFDFVYGILNVISCVLLITERENHEARGENYIVLAVLDIVTGGLLICDFIREFQKELQN